MLPRGATRALGSVMRVFVRDIDQEFASEIADVMVLVCIEVVFRVVLEGFISYM